MKPYICPNCEEEQTKVIEWNTTSKGYEFDIEKNSFNDNTQEADSSDFERYACPSCDGDIEDEDILAEIDTAING